MRRKMWTPVARLGRRGPGGIAGHEEQAETVIDMRGDGLESEEIGRDDRAMTTPPDVPVVAETIPPGPIDAGEAQPDPVQPDPVQPDPVPADPAPDATSRGGKIYVPIGGEKYPVYDPRARRVGFTGKTSPVPPIVRKIHGAIEDGRFTITAIEQQAELSPNRIYQWGYRSGQPTTSEAIRLSNLLDISLEYLLDDDVPVEHPYPRRTQKSDRRFLDILKTHQLDLATLESYLFAIATAYHFGLSPQQVHRICTAAAAERREVLAEASGVRVDPAAPEVKVTLDYPGMADQLAMEKRKAEQDRAKAEQSPRRRNGGPKPKAG